LAGWSSASLPATLAADFRGDEIIEQLPMGRRQRVEIAKALVTDPKVLLLDEPTSILAPSEVGALFAILKSLRSAGIAIVIVTHKLREVMTIADRILVMADGRVTGTFERHDGDWAPGVRDEILQRMFAWGEQDGAMARDGRRDTERRHPPDTIDSPPMLRLSGVSAASRPASRQLQEIDLDLVPGQIHAIVGIDGQGQTELAEVIAGYRRSDGRIELAGHDIQDLSSIQRARLGLGLLVDDRLGEAAIGSFTAADNLVLKRPRPPALARNGFFRRKMVAEHARSVIDAWGVEPTDPGARFGSLSGGNMQRVLAAREIEREPKVLIALNPVQGLDAMTADLLWSRLRGLCDRGSAVLVFTTDLDEALAQADRCGVIFDGRVSPLIAFDQVERNSYGTMMVNGW
ncbi:MAG: ATP-binding cassette domain-containing protein, partial [Chloroflexota bacterium]|nr:ATP-binding cassette domain-containing protein [Chloroflexota bacterium]